MKRKIIVICLILTLALSVTAFAACNDTGGSQAAAQQEHPLYYVANYFAAALEQNLNTYTDIQYVESNTGNPGTLGNMVDVDGLTGLLSCEENNSLLGTRCCYGLVFEDSFAASSCTEDDVLKLIDVLSVPYNIYIGSDIFYEVRGRVIYVSDSGAFLEDILSATAPTQYAELVNAATAIALPSDYYVGSDDQYNIEAFFSASGAGQTELEGGYDIVGYDEAQSGYVNAVIYPSELIDIDSIKEVMEEYITEMIETGEIDSGECHAGGNVVWSKVYSQESI